jgi:L-lysine 6-transaminase
MATTAQISAQEAREVLGRHMLLDGFDMVVDLDRSHGTYLVDARDGKEYLDFFTFLASGPVGMNHPRLRDESFQRELGRVAVNKPSNSDIQTLEMARFVEAMERHAMPEGMPHLFLISGGALAVENALKAAFDWKVRKNFAKGHTDEVGTRVIHFKECFHGRTGYTLSLTNSAPVKTDYYPKFDWPRIENPHARFPLTGDNLAQVEAAERRAVAQMEEAFRKHRDDIAAIIIEPVQGEGGDRHFRPEFFRELRRLADEHEAILIFDEVQTGGGLTGKFWAYEHFGVKPDIIAFGKKFQVCGIIASTRLDEVEHNVFNTSGRINSTWGGNLVDCVRATRILEIIHDENLVANAAEQGERLQAGLVALQAEFPSVISNARGLGLMCAFDVPDADTRSRLLSAAMERGMMGLPCGEVTVRVRPPLTVATEEVDRGIKILRESLKSLA